MYSFFRLHKIEHSYTFVADLENALIVGFILGLVCFAAVSSSSSDAGNLIIPVIVLASISGFIYSLIRRQQIKAVLKQRFADFTAWAQSNDAQTYPGLSSYITASKDNNITQTTLAHLSADHNYQNFLVTQSWTYCDFSYSKYRHSRGGDYKSADVYYGIIKAKLPRTLPNVFFDSKSARRRQFRFIFRRRQIYHFEGDFDEYFTTYIPSNYNLDSLSFITPDVMQALKVADEYDAEIISDEIYLYGPISDFENQIADMSAKISAIVRTLQLTVSSYHDDHLPLEAGWHDVSSEGSYLARSRFWAYVNAIAIIAYILIRFVLAAKGNG